MRQNDCIKQPKHYTYGDIECIDVIQAITKHLKGDEGYFIGNVLKYLWRWKYKNGIEDIKKAREYLDMLIAKYEVSGNEKV